jgi:heme A synthase
VASSADPAVRAFPLSASGFGPYAWAVLIYNIGVVLWGALVRATGAGAGCGSHWPLCNGEVVPRSPQMTTIIEFTHRVTSGLALIAVAALVFWAWRTFGPGHRVRKYALLSLVFILVEALLGAGLVLLEYVDQNRSVGRAVYLSAHLANTQILLAMLTLTAWYARPEAQAGQRRKSWPLLAGVLPVTLLVGISGAIAALGDTLFPATSLAEGVRQEMSDTAHVLLRLRVFHPAFAVLSALYISFAAMKVVRATVSTEATRIAWSAWGLVFVQLIAGVVNVILLAPVWMQILHLLLADLLWVLLVLLVVEGSAARRELPVRVGF